MRKRKQHIPAKDRKTVLIRDNHTCQFCGSTENLQIDHIIAESLGGSTSQENLQVLCKACNMHKGRSFFKTKRQIEFRDRCRRERVIGNPWQYRPLEEEQEVDNIRLNAFKNRHEYKLITHEVIREYHMWAEGIS